VKLEHVRGQAERGGDPPDRDAWQSGERFERAGGRRERGILFHGAPGTGKTMLAKAIATGFNSPFVTIPGSGFAQTFIGVDALIVRYLARKAKRLAAKWGGQCIVFIDEIDAVGMRRSALGGRRRRAPSTQSRRSSSQAISCSRRARGATSSSSSAPRSAGSRTGSCSSSTRPSRAGCSAAVGEAAWRSTSCSS
jgi:hypothetical protein